MIELQIFSQKHLDKTFLWMQNEDLKASFLLDKNITKDSHSKWFVALKKDQAQKNFAIIYNNFHVGNIGVKNIDLSNKKAEVWIYIGDNSFKGKGIAKESLNLLNDFFVNYINKLYANIGDFNYQSLRLFIASGYRIEGFLHDEIFFKGRSINIFRLYKIL